MEPVKTKFVKQKRVAVRYTGPIMPLGAVYGPTVPQVMDVHTIALLLQKGYRTVEILNDGTEIVLNLANYNIDNEGDGGESLKEVAKPNENITPIPSKNEKKEEPAPVEETKAPEPSEPEEVKAEEAPAKQEEKTDDVTIKVGGTVDEKKDDDGIIVNNGQNQQNFGKKDKHNKHQNQQSTSMSKADKLISK